MKVSNEAIGIKDYFTFFKKVKKVKGPDIYISQLTGKPGQQRFTMQSGRTDHAALSVGGAAQIV